MILRPPKNDDITVGEIVKKKKKRIGQRFFNGAKKKMVKSTYKIKPVKVSFGIIMGWLLDL